VKDQNGAAMSLGRISTFFDIYLQRDPDESRITEGVQELIEDFVIKLADLRFLRTPKYDARQRPVPDRAEEDR
jgi:formate C-acetyltransferase